MIPLHFLDRYDTITLRHEVHMFTTGVCVFTLVKTQARFSHTLVGDEELCVAAMELCVFRCVALFGLHTFYF